jgi:hypothetical protein
VVIAVNTSSLSPFCLQGVHIESRFGHRLQSISCETTLLCCVPVWPCGIWFFRYIYQRSLRVHNFELCLCFAADSWIHLFAVIWWSHARRGVHIYLSFILFFFFLSTFPSVVVSGWNPPPNAATCKYGRPIVHF